MIPSHLWLLSMHFFSPQWTIPGGQVSQSCSSVLSSQSRCPSHFQSEGMHLVPSQRKPSLEQAKTGNAKKWKKFSTRRKESFTGLQGFWARILASFTSLCPTQASGSSESGRRLHCIKYSGSWGNPKTSRKNPQRRLVSAGCKKFYSRETGQSFHDGLNKLCCSYLRIKIYTDTRVRPEDRI